ncbi:MAG: TIGR03790 family protein [Verrucomicrobiia bacterium]
MMLRATICFIVAALLAADMVWAGGSGLNVIVVVNQNSTNSVQLGNDYCEQRGVPPQNVLRTTGWTVGSTDWSPGDFETNLLNPLLAMIASRGLTNQAEFVLLSMDIPYRVADSEADGGSWDSTTSVLFYGFKTNTAQVEGVPNCSLPNYSSNSYAYSELPFSQAPPNTATTNSFLAMMLTDTNLAAAENTLCRSVAADCSYPTQTVYLAKTDDSAENVRFVEFDNSVFENQVVGNYAVTRIDTDSTAFTNLFGLQTGLNSFSLATNAFVPGSLGDNLNSYGGFIFENSFGQATALAFLEAGTAGSYGTVSEACSYTQKFPNPLDYFYQTRGFSLAEAYYQSVLNPYEGLLVGEPLAAPFARPGRADWSSLTNGSVLSGQATLSPVFTAAATNLPLARVDLFVDGTFFQTMTNLPPVAGNTVSATLNGYTCTYTVPTNATLASVAAGLANALNTYSTNTQVQAFPAGDRIELQSLTVMNPGSNVTVTTSSAIGSASGLATQLTAARPVFLDTVATGYQEVAIVNTPTNGDWLQFTFQKTNGDVVTIGVTNTTSGITIGTLAQNLVNLINATPALQSADGLFASDFYDYDNANPSSPEVLFTLYANTPGWLASQILATLTTSPDLLSTPTGPNPLADNVSDLRPRNHLYLSSGADSLAVSFVCDTTQLADGYHQLTAVAYEGDSVETQTRATRNVQIQNTSLTAALTALPTGTNATLDQQMQFTVTANTTNVASIELFSTGGSLGAVTNQAAAVFEVSAAYLGLGLHPFYALVTDETGHRYQTQTIWYRVLPAITVVFAPSISVQPVGQGVAAGTSATLSVTASGAAPLSYQWWDSAGAILAATNASYMLNPAQTNNSDNYFVVVTNAYGSVTSSVAALVVYLPVTITSQPASQVVPALSTAMFAVTASSYPAPFYQWTFNNTNLPGATSSTLVISNVLLANLGDYAVLVGNGFSSNTSDTATLSMSPSITMPFVGGTAVWGYSATLSVGAIGTGLLSYQWFQNGVAIADATNPVFSLSSVQFTNGGPYSVVVSSDLGSVTNTALLVVNPAGTVMGMCASITITGVPGYTYVIQYTSDLAVTNSWITLTNLTLQQPVELWVDTSTNAQVVPHRYYQVLPGQ